MFKHLANIVALTLITISVYADGPSGFPNGTSNASLPELYVLGIANPFPTLYILNAQGRIVLQGKGKDASAFQFDFRKLEDRPLPQTESVEKIQLYFESRNKKGRVLAPDADYFLYFFKLDPDSFDGRGCAPCEKLEDRLIRNIRNSGQDVYLEIILVTNP